VVSFSQSVQNCTELSMRKQEVSGQRGGIFEVASVSRSMNNKTCFHMTTVPNPAIKRNGTGQGSVWGPVACRDVP
jgi:hypothetical protein